MKVYILRFHMQMSGFRFSTYSKDETLGVYSKEASVKQKLDSIKKEFLSQGSGFMVHDHTNGHGFTGYHEAGDTSFVPGSWFYEEQEVID